MNIMRKIVNQSSRILGDSAYSGHPDQMLGLMHLRKLFAEINKPGAASKDIEHNLYNMLPLFCKVFNTSSAEEMMEKFPDVLQFCNHVSRLMVNEIRRRASNQSTEAACCSIVKFLEIESTQEQSSGWMLLTTVNLLASLGLEAFINGMTLASLPSTLVKCFCLFFDLPEVDNPDVLEPGSEFTPRERRVLLQKVFVQVLIRLCSYTSPAEELVRKDDLMLLFVAVTSSCPPHNVTWRKSAAEVLMTLSRHGLTPNVVQYIHGKGCVGVCIDNMQRNRSDLSPIEMVEMLVTLFCFLKDSSEVSQMILDDFRSSSGYTYLSEFLLSTEKADSDEAVQALRNLILLVGSLCSCGFIELKPSLKGGSLFQMPGFVVPQSSGNGMSIRNLQAFHVLQTVFLKSTSSQLCSTILDVIISLYNQDASNYFILEPQNTLPQFAEKIHLKHPDIQTKFFEIIEYVAFNLNFVPCKELISLSILIRANHSQSCNILCMKTLLRLLHHHPTYKDVFREVGLLEVVVVCLQRFQELLPPTTAHGSPSDAPSEGVRGDRSMTDDDRIMGFLVMDALLLLLNSNNNAGVFRECGGARCVHGLVPHGICRSKALSIVQQLIVSSGGEDDLRMLLTLLHSSSPESLELKIHIVKSLLQVLKESHKSRTAFRKVGGFVYVMSVLVSMEGALSDQPKAPWTSENRPNVLLLVKLMFSTLTVVMRFEPANARFFATEVRYSSLTEAIRLLGCFGNDSNAKSRLTCASIAEDYEEEEEEEDEWTNQGRPSFQALDQLHYFFHVSSLDGDKHIDYLPGILLHATLMMRHLYDMALDNFDRIQATTIFQPLESMEEQTNPAYKRHSSVLESGQSGAGVDKDFTPIGQSQKRGSTGSIGLTTVPTNQEMLVVHPGAVLSILHLIPAITCSQGSEKKLARHLRYQMCEVVKSLVRSERNQQVMCDAGLLGELFRQMDLPLFLESHYLHPPLQYIFERLSAQSLTPKELRHFFRLGLPLCSASEDEESYDARRLAGQSCGGATFATAMDCTEGSGPSSAGGVQPHGHHPPHLHYLASVSSFSSLLSPVGSAAFRDRFLFNEKSLSIEASLPVGSVQVAAQGGTVPLTRVKCLVSMTTPRDVRLAGTSVVPSFVEFDMQPEGFGCLYLPSVAPQGPGVVIPSMMPSNMIGAVSSSLSSEQPVVSGIGSGERAFPPSSGLTYLSWICVDKFGSHTSDPHPVRLLTVVRTIREDEVVCLEVYLSAKDRHLVISTQEVPLQNLASAENEHDDLSSSSSSSSVIRVHCPELMHEGQWHHLAIVFHRASMLKNSSLSVVVDDTPIATHKLHYMSPYVVPSASSSSFPMSVYAYVGTPPHAKRTSRLMWRQGPCYLIEEVLNMAAVQFVYRLGPNYVGSFQAPCLDHTTEVAGPLVSEEKIVFGIHAHAMSLVTVAKIRKIFNRTDAKGVARQLGVSPHENATPVRILHNSAGHLAGPARSFGAILVGYLGVRTFCPKPVAKVIMCVAGTPSLLGLTAMATSVEGLYAAVKALVCVVRSSKDAAKEMDMNKGYQHLAMIFKKKRHLLNSHILHLTFSLVGTLDSGRENSVITNRASFESLLADLEIWHEAPYDLQKSLYEHFYDLLTESSDQKWNKNLMLELGLVGKLLTVASDSGISSGTLQSVCAVLHVLLSGPPYHPHSILKLGQFMASLVPSVSVDERSFVVAPVSPSIPASVDRSPSRGSNGVEPFDATGSLSVFGVRLRNVLLGMVDSLVSSSVPFARPSSSPASSASNTPSRQQQQQLQQQQQQQQHHQQTINVQFCEELHKTLGTDWLLLFIQGHLHRSTVVSSLSILLKMLRHPTLLLKFREGTGGGGWLADAHCVVVGNRLSLFGGLSVGNRPGLGNSNPSSSGIREVNPDLCNVPGFVALNWLLSQHASVSKVYFLLVVLLLNQPVRDIPDVVKFNLDTIWTHVFGIEDCKPLNRLSGKLDFCMEAAIILLSLVRVTFNCSTIEQETDLWVRDYPIVVVQFFLYVYHHQSDFGPVCMSADFLGALSSTLFPLHSAASESGSDISSPADDFRPFSSFDQLLPPVGSSDKTGSLITHAAKKFVLDFLRRIILDSLSIPVPSKSLPVIDMVLEVSPEHSTRHERRQFQTEVLTLVMDHMLAVDILLGAQGLPGSGGSGSGGAGGTGGSGGGGGSYQHLSCNVFYLAGRVVDKLWQGAFMRDPNEVFEFINLLISQAKRKASGISLESIYKSLNRTILYQLSRPLTSCNDLQGVADTLQKLLTNRILIFGPGNYDQEFVGCLCYCLLQICDLSPNNISSPPSWRTTTWHVSTPEGATDLKGEDVTRDQTGSVSAVAPVNMSEGLRGLADSARKVWEELFISKRPVIEEIFKVTLMTSSDPNNVKKLAVPDIVQTKSQILEPATKVWLAYYENERKCVYSQSDKMHSQLHAKLQKVLSQGMLKLAARKTKKDIVVKTVYVTQQEWLNGTSCHLSIIKDLVDLRQKQYLQSHNHMMTYLEEEWKQVEMELMRERGLWGSQVGSDLDKWMLDPTEGPCRMRKKMIKNPLFYEHYPFKPDMEANREIKYKMAISFDSRPYAESYKAYSLIEAKKLMPPGFEGQSQATAPGGAGELNQDPLCNHMTSFSGDADVTDIMGDLRVPSSLLKDLPKSVETSEDDVIDGDLEMAPPSSSSTSSVDSALVMDGGSTHLSRSDPRADGQAIFKLLEEGETITHMFRCARIQGLDTVEGLLLFVREHFYIVDGFTLFTSKDVTDIVDIDSLPLDSHEPIIPKAAKYVAPKKMCFKMAFNDMREVHKRRYLLQPIAIEIFSADGRNFLLAFPKKMRNKIYSRFMAVGTALTDSAHESVSGQRSSAKVEQGSGLISTLIGEKSVTQRWERGEITNFEYLMCLNTLAGRSYNDLMQYPVFPWILADYDSDELDLTSQSTFRDLSAPMGAQTPDRLKQFKKRYSDWDDPHGETPPYHYGTHYSSAMIVASYLVRMEPFTQTFLRLQGGHFDLADRMFHSIKDAWLSASKHNMADVKELIPEFFYLPEFLVNSNNFDLGVKQSGVSLGDVVLPPWAKGDPREFIRCHREALECDYVSSRLHEWIDLIFGHKQRPPAAVDAVNVFHHLFYEGNVNIYDIDDPLKKNAIIGFINNFGQIPKQLFKKPHPQKRLSIKSFPSIPLASQLSYSVSSSSSSASGADRIFFHNLDNLTPSMQPIKELKGAVGQMVCGEKAMLAVEQNKTLIPFTYSRYLAWGFPDMSIRIGNYDSEKAIAIVENVDCGDILCAASPNDKTFITAGTSTVVKVWRLNFRKEGNARSGRSVLELRKSLFGHTEAVTCLSVSSAYNIVVSGSRDRTCIMWDLNELCFVRQLRGHAAPVAAVHINELTGDIATCSGTYLHMWSVNGEELANINTATGPHQQILCVTMSQVKEWEVDNVILTGNSDGVVRMWSLEFVEVLDESKKEPEDVFGAPKVDVAGPSEGNEMTEVKIAEPEPLTGSHPDEGGTPSRRGSILKEWLERRAEKKHVWGDDEEESEEGLGSAAAAGQSRADWDPTADRVKTFVDERSYTPPPPPVMSQYSRQSHVDPDVVFDSSDASAKDRTLSSSSSHSKDFYVVTEEEIKEIQQQQQSQQIRNSVNKQGSFGNRCPPFRRQGGLREGFKWHRQLVFRSKLTMHTAFERRDNKDPAAVTSLSVSKDHRTVYVGDAKGHVYSWSATDQPGKGVADHWVKDDGGDYCHECSIRFSFAERKHHCRNCGQLFCSRCSNYESEIKHLKMMKPVRVCHACFRSLKMLKQSED